MASVAITSSFSDGFRENATKIEVQNNCMMHKVLRWVNSKLEVGEKGGRFYYIYVFVFIFAKEKQSHSLLNV